MELSMLLGTLKFVGGCQGFRKHASFFVKLVNIVSVIYFLIFHFSCVVMNIWFCVYLQCKSLVTKFSLKYFDLFFFIL